MDRWFANLQFSPKIANTHILCFVFFESSWVLNLYMKHISQESVSYHTFILSSYLKFEDITFCNLSICHYYSHDKQICVITGDAPKPREQAHGWESGLWAEVLFRTGRGSRRVEIVFFKADVWTPAAGIINLDVLGRLLLSTQCFRGGSSECIDKRNTDIKIGIRFFKSRILWFKRYSNTMKKFTYIGSAIVLAFIIICLYIAILEHI